MQKRNAEKRESPNRRFECASYANAPDSMSKVEIQYLSHEEGAKSFGSYFGLKEEDFPEGAFLR